MKRRPGRHRSQDPAIPLPTDEPGPRVVRLEHLLFEEIDRLLRLEVVDRRVQCVAVVGVQLSPDLRNARVRYAVRAGAATPPQRDIDQGLERIRPFLRARVAEAVSLKRVPELHFHRDRLAEASLRVEEVLQQERMAPLRARLGDDRDGDGQG